MSEEHGLGKGIAALVFMQEIAFMFVCVQPRKPKSALI